MYQLWGKYWFHKEYLIKAQLTLSTRTFSETLLIKFPNKFQFVFIHQTVWAWIWLVEMINLALSMVLSQSRRTAVPQRERERVKKNHQIMIVRWPHSHNFSLFVPFGPWLKNHRLPQCRESFSLLGFSLKHEWRKSLTLLCVRSNLCCSYQNNVVGRLGTIKSWRRPFF